MRYRDAGVDVERADLVKQALARAVRSTWTKDVRPLEGGFAGLIAMPGSGVLAAASLDGVGTKMQLALSAGRAGDAAADLVYHLANDLLVHGAKPWAFLDYVAQARLDPARVLEIVEGMARACREVGAALLGGETAEMPGTYLPDVADVAGCMLGVVEPAAVLDGGRIRAGDRVLGLASAGLHTNGFSLARAVLEASGAALADPLPGGSGESLGAALLAPHRWYGPGLEPLLAAGTVHALAHVTGGGIAGNLVRVLPEGRRALIDVGAWPRPPLFRWLIGRGAVPEDDARRALNLGIGMVVVVAEAEAKPATAALAARGEQVHALGRIVAGARGVEWEDG